MLIVEKYIINGPYKSITKYKWKQKTFCGSEQLLAQLLTASHYAKQILLQGHFIANESNFNDFLSSSIVKFVKLSSKSIYFILLIKVASSISVA